MALKIYMAPSGSTWEESTLYRHRVSPLDYRLKLFSQDDKFKPRELELTMDRRAPITKYGRVLVLDDDDGTVKFNGYVERQTSLTREKRKFLCKGNEQRLTGRYLPKIPVMGRWPTGALYSVLADKLSYGEFAEYNPGALFCANSFWPPGSPFSVYDSAKNIIKLSYADHHVDARGKAFYLRRGFDMVPLTCHVNLSDLQSHEGVHIDSDLNIYIRADDSNWYAVGALFVDGAFDTLCRTGTFGKWSTTWAFLRGPISTDFNEIASFYFNIIKRHGLYLSLRDDLNYTYLDHSASNSRVTGITIFEKDLLEFERVSPAEPDVEAVIVRGGGRQFYSVLDGRSGPGIFKYTQYDNTYRRDGAMLKSLTESLYTQCNAQDTVAVKCRAGKYGKLRPDDAVSLAIDEEAQEHLRISQITEEPNTLSMQLGTKRPGLSDFWDDRSAETAISDRSLYEILPEYSESITFKPRDSGHACTDGSLSINFPTGIIGPTHLGNRLLILLSASFSLDQAPYTADGAGWNLLVKVNGSEGYFGRMDDVNLEDGLDNIDITDMIVEGANSITIRAEYLAAFSNSHGGCNAGEMFPGIDWIQGDEWNGHPDLTASVTIKFYRMNYS